MLCLTQSHFFSTNLFVATLFYMLKSVFSPQVNLPVNVLRELGAQLGLCDTRSPETHQLTHDYFSVINTVKEEQMRGKGGHCWAEVNAVLCEVTVLKNVPTLSLTFHLF